MKTAAVRAKPRAAQVGTHERQARHLAARFMRGDTHIGHAVAPTHSATFLLPASAGALIPFAIRRDFEHAFDADLSRVHVHTDPVAAAFAERLGARAFAAGTHVYFNTGNYRPEVASGRELLAHEIVHVLQQTGRRASLRTWAALESSGPGLLQCAPTFESVRRLHAGAKPETADYTGLADSLAAIDGDPAAVMALVNTHKKTLVKLSDQSLSLLYDAAKRAGAFDVAAELIELDNFNGGRRISTTFYSPKVDEALIKRSLGQFVFQRAITTIPDLKLYYSEWLRMIEMGLLQPLEDKTPPLLRNLDPASGSKSTKWETIQKHDDALAHGYTGAQLNANEWYLWGLRRLRIIDDSRIQGFDTARSQAFKVKQSRWLQRVTLVDHLKDWVARLKVAKGSAEKAPVEKWQPFHEIVAADVEKILGRVQAVWASVQDYKEAKAALDEARKTGQAIDVETDAQWAAIVSLAKSSGVAAHLVSVLKTLNASDRKKNRIPANYLDISRDQAKTLRLLVDKAIEDPVLYWFRTGKTKQLIAALWLQQELHPILRMLEWQWNPFTQAQGTAAVALSPGFVQAHRIATAQHVGTLGGKLALKSLETAAEEMLTAYREPDSILAILPDAQGNVWHLDEVPSGQLLKDFSATVLGGAEPLRAYHLVLLYQSRYLEELKAKLDARLPTDAAGETEAVTSGRLGPNIIATSARQAREEMELRGEQPQRWTVSDTWRHTYFAGRKEGKSFSALLFEHLNTQQFYTDARRRGMEGFVPMEPPTNAYVWLWPPHPRVTTLLRQISVLNEIVALRRHGSREAPAVAKVTAHTDDVAWLADVHAVLGVSTSTAPRLIGKAEMDALLIKVDRFFEAYRKSAHTSLESSYHAATRIDRRRLADTVRYNLALYEKDPRRTNVAMEQAASMQMFYSSLLVLFGEDLLTVKDPDTGHETITVPAASRPRLHLAALMLEVADAMQSSLKKERKGVVVHEYLGLLGEGYTSALELSKKPEPDRRTYLPPHESGDVLVAQRLASLQAITTQFQQYRESLQKSAGFVADEPANVLNVALRFSDPIPAGTVLLPRTGYGLLGADPTGQRYRFVRVVRSFQFHPEWGDRQAQSTVSAPTGYGAAMILEPDGSAPLSMTPGEPLLIVEELDRDDNVIREIRIGGAPADFPMLASVYSGALYWAFGSSMGNVQAAIEKYVNTLVDLAELIPGWGKLITAAKIVAAIADFWSADVYKDMVRVVNGDMKQFFTGLLDTMAQAARPGALLEFVLFGNPRLDSALTKSTLLGAPEDAKWNRKPVETRSKLGHLKKTFAAMKNLGKAFAKALNLLRTKVQQPMLDTREYVSTRPALSFALHFGAAHVYDVVQLASKSAAILGMLSEKEQKDSSLVDELRRTLGAEQAEFGARLHGMLDTLAELELPERLVDVTPAVQFVLDELVIFVGNRLGLQGKVVIMILTKSGVLDFFTSRIAHELVSSGFDPNVYWRDEIIPSISDSFNATRDSLIKDINALLANPAFDGMFSHIAPGQPLVLEPNTDEPYQDLRPYPSRDRKLIARPRNLPSVDAGAPIPDEARAPFERGFGQDFRHVRVHGGASGDAMTRAFGAEALTSGSHIFLRAGLDVRGGTGAEVMGHELAHTVQQTGRQPLGRKRPAQPKPARPERGLDLDPSAEAEATRLAAAVRTGITGGSIPSEPRDHGVQPYTLEDLDPYLLARILRGFNTVEELKKRQEQLDAPASGPQPARTEDTNAIDVLVGVIEGITKKNSKLTVQVPAVFSGPIDASGGDKTPVLDKILAELQKKLEPAPFKKVVRKIAVQAQDEIKQPRQKGKRPPAIKPQYVNPAHFVRQLEGYIFAKTGIALALDLKTSAFKAPNGDTLHQIDPVAPLSSVKLLHVYLPYIAPNADLSTFAIKNTWPASRTDDKLRGQLSALVRSHLAGLGVRSTVWALFGKTYQFSIFMKRDIDAMMSAKLTQGGVLDPDNLTAPDIYADPDLSKSQTSAIGVRVSTYGHSNQRGSGRHSHHLTQFLIADYFANANDTRQPFRSGRAYPGVEFNGDVVRYISPDPVATASGIKVEDTFGSKSKRGEAMPAISLAASTHMSGDLHITPAPDDLGGSVKKTQSYAVDKTFRDKLPDELEKDAPDAAYKRYRKQHKDSDIATTIHSAVQHTFQKWSEHMNTQLTKNVPRLELAYYIAMAGCATKTTAVKTCATNTGEQQKLLGLLQDATKVAEQQNYKEMALYNWKQS